MVKLFDDRSKTGDVNFIVESEVIPAHRCILAALSPKYKAQFYGALAEKDVIKVADISPAAFKEFLQFFYMDEVMLTLENIEDVLNLAKQSLVDNLVTECTNFLVEVIGMDRLLWCYQLALHYDCKVLKEFCVKQIGVNIRSVFQSKEFLDCERDMLCHILAIDSLNCSETGVFDACIAWAKVRCEHEQMDANDTANLRAALGDALLKIRFCSMKVDEFATINKMYLGLLPAHLSVEVFHAIALKSNDAHSSTFDDNNSKVRAPIKSSLECSFAKGPRIPYDSINGTRTIEFYTDKDIILNGFVVCNRIDHNTEVKIRYRVRPTVRPVTTMSTSGNETKIAFDQPIRMEAGGHCFIEIHGKEFKQSNPGWYGFDLETDIKQNGVKFVFPHFIKSNLITRLLFNIDGVEV